VSKIRSYQDTNQFSLSINKILFLSSQNTNRIIYEIPAYSYLLWLFSLLFLRDESANVFL
jgi:hypothetical protein